MSMKIDGHRQPADADQTRRLESATAVDRAGKSGTPSERAGDRVEVSAEMRLVNAAREAVLALPDVRPEAVERGRRALELGTLGADADRLADRMIASLLDE
jgi:flagellar biosynthesis anti-sigma factor FlgM